MQSKLVARAGYARLPQADRLLLLFGPLIILMQVLGRQKPQVYEI
jgi:hypothetical protein